MSASDPTPAIRRVSPADIRLSPSDALSFLAFFFPLEPTLAIGQLSLDDRGFAQALLVEALKETAMEMEEPTPPETSETPETRGAVPAPRSLATGYNLVQSELVRFLKRARMAWFAPVPPERLAYVSISEYARSNVAIRYRTLWLARLQRGTLLWPPQV